MKEVQFNIFFCEMNEETFSEQIMIYKPDRHIVRRFTEETLSRLHIIYAGEWIACLKRDAKIRQALDTYGLENLTLATVYIQDQDYLLGLREDKSLSQIFDDLKTNRLNFIYFVVGGGASIHNETSYRFTVHPDEKIHAHMPHVHVSKGGVEIRYSLETLLPIDPLVNPHKHDNRKIIIPFLQQNHERLLQMWSRYVKGYTTPEITQDGRQFYSES